MALASVTGGATGIALDVSRLVARSRCSADMGDGLYDSQSRVGRIPPDFSHGPAFHADCINSGLVRAASTRSSGQNILDINGRVLHSIRPHIHRLVDD